MLDFPAQRFLHEVSGVIHVGANTGRERVRYAQFDLDVFWVEPIPEVFTRLTENLHAYPKQRAAEALVTDVDGRELPFHVSSNNGASSSILALDKHRLLWPSVHFTRTITLTSITLPSLIRRLGINLRLYQALILDTQGSELLVLQGAIPVLDAFTYIQVEVADFESYSGCCQLPDIQRFMDERGFTEIGRREFAKQKGTGSYFDLVYRKGPPA